MGLYRPDRAWVWRTFVILPSNIPRQNRKFSPVPRVTFKRVTDVIASRVVNDILHMTRCFVRSVWGLYPKVLQRLHVCREDCLVRIRCKERVSEGSVAFSARRRGCTAWVAEEKPRPRSNHNHTKMTQNSPHFGPSSIQKSNSTQPTTVWNRRWYSEQYGRTHN